MSYGETAAGRRPTEYELRQEMVRVGRLLWERGYVAGTDGNLSARLGPNRLLVTVTGQSKGFLSLEDLLVIRLDGERVSGSEPASRGRAWHRRRASSEILMHLEVYRQRSDVQAVVHAHPPIATAFSIAGVSLAKCVLPEVIVTLGGIPTAEYATPGTAEVPESIRLAIREYDAIILAHHGSLTLGSSLWEAYLRLEKVEHAAQITLAAHQLGRVHTLSPEAVAKLTEMRRELLQRQGRDICEGCSVCLLGDGDEQVMPATAGLAQLNAATEDQWVRQITETIMHSLKGAPNRR